MKVTNNDCTSRISAQKGIQLVSKISKEYKNSCILFNPYNSGVAVMVAWNNDCAECEPKTWIFECIGKNFVRNIPGHIQIKTGRFW